MKTAIYGYEFNDQNGVIKKKGWIVFKKPWFLSWHEALDKSMTELIGEAGKTEFQKPLITFFNKL